MEAIWLVEAGVYGAEADPLLAEIRRQGMAGDFVPFRTIQKDGRLVVGGRLVGEADCVVGYGTFPFAREIQLHRHWVPGAWCNPDNLDCGTYFMQFGKFLLNQPHEILPGVEAIRQRERLFAAFSREDEVFIRPTGCQKLFVGRCVHWDAFEAALAPTKYDPATKVVVAAPKKIDREWRLVVVEDRVVAASQYAEDGTRAVSPGCPESVRFYAEMILTEVRWRPDSVFMLDVCESEGRLWLIEINGFSCSWLYQCDLQTVVAEVSKLARQAWQRAAGAATPL